MKGLLLWILRVCCGVCYVCGSVEWDFRLQDGRRVCFRCAAKARKCGPHKFSELGE